MWPHMRSAKNSLVCYERFFGTFCDLFYILTTRTVVRRPVASPTNTNESNQGPMSTGIRQCVNMCVTF